jgi:hypothetical protein
MVSARVAMTVCWRSASDIPAVSAIGLKATESL